MTTTPAIRKTSRVPLGGPCIRKTGIITQVGNVRDTDDKKRKQDPRRSWLPRLAVNQRILPEIIAECERFKEVDIETGSVLLGRATRRGTQRVIAVETSLPPGEGLDRQRASFSQASLLHDELLAWFQGTDPNIQYLGDWHRHEGMQEPSHGDLMTAKAVLDDADFGVDELLVVIACHHGQRWYHRPAEPWLADALRRTRFDADEYSVRFYYLARGMRNFAELQPEPFLRDDDGQTMLYEQWYTSRSGRLEHELKLLDAIGFTPRLHIAGKRPNLSFVFESPRWKNQIILITGARYPLQLPGGKVIEGNKSHPFSTELVGVCWGRECNLARFLVAALELGLHGPRR